VPLVDLNLNPWLLLLLLLRLLSLLLLLLHKANPVCERLLAACCRCFCSCRPAAERRVAGEPCDVPGHCGGVLRTCAARVLCIPTGTAQGAASRGGPECQV